MDFHPVACIGGGGGSCWNIVYVKFYLTAVSLTKIVWVGDGFNVYWFRKWQHKLN